MGKVLKTIGKVAMFVGLAAATIATAGGAGWLAATIDVSVKTLTAITTGLLVSGSVLQTIGQSTMKKEGAGLGDAASRGNAYADPNALGAFIFGETAAPCSAVWEQNYGAEKQYVATMFAHAEGFTEAQAL